jgi:hypothetical protein
LQALGLSFLLALIAAVVFWFFALSVPGRRQVAIGEWRRDLSVIADARRDFLDRRISSDLANFGIVKQSGGYVDVASAPGAGTTFRVYLPRTNARTTSGARPPVCLARIP